MYIDRSLLTYWASLSTAAPRASITHSQPTTCLVIYIFGLFKNTQVSFHSHNLVSFDMFGDFLDSCAVRSDQMLVYFDIFVFSFGIFSVSFDIFGVSFDEFGVSFDVFGVSLNIFGVTFDIIGVSFDSCAARSDQTLAAYYISRGALVNHWNKVFFMCLFSYQYVSFIGLFSYQYFHTNWSLLFSHVLWSLFISTGLVYGSLLSIPALLHFVRCPRQPLEQVLYIKRDLCLWKETYVYEKFLRSLLPTSAYCNTLHHTASHCNTLLRIATHCNTLQHTTSHCNVLLCIATRCNTLQHTATHNLLHLASYPRQGLSTKGEESPFSYTQISFLGLLCQPLFIYTDLFSRSLLPASFHRHRSLF